VLCEGQMHMGVFRVAGLGFPPPEPRAQSVKALAARGIDMFGGKKYDDHDQVCRLRAIQALM